MGYNSAADSSIWLNFGNWVHCGVGLLHGLANKVNTQKIIWAPSAMHYILQATPTRMPQYLDAPGR